ncbi:MAG: hypothetical protein HGA47_00705 [Zoogloea sp.]|nr:hypothetical protein [Zoogloea sp.]
MGLCSFSSGLFGTSSRDIETRAAAAGATNEDQPKLDPSTAIDPASAPAMQQMNQGAAPPQAPGLDA